MFSIFLRTRNPSSEGYKTIQMDSESYLTKLIRSGSKHTADSLYLQTTIGKDIRWPIVLLVSTVVTVTTAVICIVWMYIRVPRSRRNSQEDDPQVVISTPASLEYQETRKFCHNYEEQTSFIYQKLLDPERPHKARSELSLDSYERTSVVSPKRSVSWQSTTHVKSLPRSKRQRRHSEIAPRPSGSIICSSLQPILRRYSISGSSSLITNHPQDTTESDATVIKVCNPSDLHLQISKTIAVLDDINKSLQENHERSDHPLVAKAQSSSTLVEIHKKTSMKNKARPQKVSKPTTRNVENMIGDSKETIMFKSRTTDKSGLKDVESMDEPETLINVKFDLFCGQ